MYAIIRRYVDYDRDTPTRSFKIGHVHYGFPDRRSAEIWNEYSFPSPEYNLIVPCSEVK